jgi:hypothetical protein
MRASPSLMKNVALSPESWDRSCVEQLQRARDRGHPAAAAVFGVAGFHFN